MELKSGQITRAQRKKLKIHEDNGIVAYMEEALKIKLKGFEGHERASKLFCICLISKDQTTLPSPVGFWTRRLWSSQPTVDVFLFFDSIDLRSSRLCSWGFEDLVSLRFFLSI
ncbi:hypothetical protein M9H77_07999 [Catharanthus roseus]|uniref:Uncharacterized protein n=1 Tax=Catharanthus roseus TaxID=4058 RepID=A0ACC0BWR0_CATRO|nr:hypothetical protein M9H77_07999 [Catharanthus roseus]